MNCTRCAQPIEPGATFCGNCGQAVAAPAAVPAPPQPPVVAAPAPSPVSQALTNAADANAPSGPVATAMPSMVSAAPSANPPNPPMVPSYAIANPVQQKGETKAMVGLVVSILGMPAALVPFLGMLLGITGLVLGTTTRAAAVKKTIGTLSIIFSIIAILASIAMYIYSYNTLVKQKAANSGGNSSAANQDAAKSASPLRTVDTPCFKAEFPQLNTLENASGSCSLKTYDTTSSVDANNLYTVDVLTKTGLSEADFIATAKDKLGQALKSNLPDFVASSEKATTFANSPAYIITGKYQGNVGAQLVFVLHQTTHGENIIIIVHAINNGTGDAAALQKNWIWK